jgi:hypothetical protein
MISVGFVAQIFHIKLMRRSLCLVCCVVVSAGILRVPKEGNKEENQKEN